MSAVDDSEVDLRTPIQYLKGVGPKRAQLLTKLGLATARDVLFFFPRDYQDMSELRAIERLREDEPVSVSGVIEDIEIRNTGPNRSLVGLLIRQGTQYFRAVWFNQPYMFSKFARDSRVLVSGVPKKNGLRWEMIHPHIEPLGDDEEPPAGQILPTYSLTEGINQTQMRRVVHGVVRSCADRVEEVLPEDFRTQHQLASIQDALCELHVPTSSTNLEHARRRFVFQELLVMQLALAIRRRRLLSRGAAQLEVTGKIDARIRRLFPFRLTTDQNQAIEEICQDLAKEVPMNRLLQGDVGSGKTVVAQYAMLLAVAHGYQAVLMAPTEILAQQHALTFGKSLANSRAQIGLLTGSISTSERRETLAALATGEINLLIGTHSVLSESVEFDKLGLVVIDEQHKFGVGQRAQLRGAALSPHYLVMTATPIPRTISMTLYGDLEVSTLRQSPPGREALHTYVTGAAEREKWWTFFRKKLREGRQGYVVTPLVDDSSSVELASVEQTFERLANGELEEFRLDLIHGQQSGAEKEAAMAAFRSGETQVLITTSVVEVGVDVPNATLMTIENGERFGLAQLHQLRGRITRGSHPGFLCVFTAEPNSEATERLEAFRLSTDGFELAERDLELRGPGDLFGFRQHGLPALRIADLRRDGEVVGEARGVAQQLIDADPELEAPEMSKLKRMVSVRYGKALELGDVG